MAPFARTVASSQARDSARTLATSGDVSAREVVAVASASRVSARRLDVLAGRLGDRDREVMTFVADWRLASGSQLCRLLFGGDDRAARRALKRLSDWRISDRLARRVGGVRRGSAGFVYCLGPAGHRLLAREGLSLRRLGTPGNRHLAHVLAITELNVRLTEADQRGELELLSLEPEPQCWRAFIGPAGTRVVVKPDLAIRIGVGALEDRWLIEVDRATERLTTIHAKARRYVAHARSGSEQREHGTYPRVLWTVPTPQRGDAIRDTLARLAPSERALFEVELFDAAAGFLAAEARA
jgi:hypothetical protein